MTASPKSLFSVGPWASPGLVNVIIDTPAGSRNKYKFDEESGLFKLSRILPDGLHFPCDFGSIPGTREEDGDALDAAVLNMAASFVGCLVMARPLGLIRAVQWEKRRRIQNDRLIVVPVTPVNRPRVRRLRDINQQCLADLESFFKSYNLAQGRRFEVIGRQEAPAALRSVSASVLAHARESRKR